MNSSKTTALDKAFETPESILLEAVNDLIEAYETPDKFLEFILDSINDVHELDRGKKAIPREHESVFSLTLIVEHIIKPWYIKNTNGMIDGLRELLDTFGPGALFRDIANIVEAIQDEMRSSVLGKERMAKAIKGLKAVIKISESILIYELITRDAADAKELNEQLMEMSRKSKLPQRV